MNLGNINISSPIYLSNLELIKWRGQSQGLRKWTQVGVTRIPIPSLFISVNDCYITIKLAHEERTEHDELAEIHGLVTLGILIRVRLDDAKNPSILDPTANGSSRRVRGEEAELLSVVNSQQDDFINSG
ncbi:MAG: hypothetical protein ACFFFG_14325 [Candidatus Thorarchaeota archaeon]